MTKLNYMITIQSENVLVKYRNQLLVVGLHVILLVLLLSTYARNAIWDEDIFRRNCFLLNEMGFTGNFLRSMQVQAPGPLYQFFHLIFFPITGYGLFKMRLVNFFIFILTEIIAYKTFTLLVKDNSKEENLFNVLMILAFPGYFVSAIFCMSEAPTYFILAVVLYFLARQQLKKFVFDNSLLHHFLLGLLMGLLIIGRTQFLVIPFVYFIVNGYIHKNLKNLVYPLLTIVVSLLVAAPIFIIWGGLVPPQVAVLEAAGISQLNFRNVFIIMGYFVFIQYALLRNKILITRKELMLFGIIGLVLFCVNQFYLGIPYGSSSLHFMPPTLMFTLVTLVTLLALYQAAKEGFLMLQSKNMLSLFSYASALLVLFTMIKMNHYNVGVRHIGQAGLLLVLGNVAYQNKCFSNYRYQYSIIMIFIALNFLVILNQLFGYPTPMH